MDRDIVLRDACDACHRRKMRCPSEGAGACANCRRTGQVCQFSPRSEMGRPRLNNRAGKRDQQRRTGKPANTHTQPRASSAVAITSTTTAAAPEVAVGVAHSAREDTAPLSRTDRDPVYRMEETQTETRAIQETGKAKHLNVDATDGDAAMMEGGVWDLASTDAPSSWGSGLMEGLSTSIPDAHSFCDSWVPDMSPSATSMALYHQTLATFARFDEPNQTAASPRPHRTSDNTTNAAATSNSPTLVLCSNPTTSSSNSPSLFRDVRPSFSTDSLLDAYSELSHILYALRKFSSPAVAQITGSECLPLTGGNCSSSKQQTPCQAQQHRTLDKAFFMVSSLCDIISWLASSPLPPGSSELPCLMLVASVSATVVDMYRKTAEVFMDAASRPAPPSRYYPHHQRQHLSHSGQQQQRHRPEVLTPTSPADAGKCPIGSSASNGNGNGHDRAGSGSTGEANPSSVLSLGGTQQHLQMVSDATIMELHLAQLQKGLAMLQGTAHILAKERPPRQHQQGKKHYYEDDVSRAGGNGDFKSNTFDDDSQTLAQLEQVRATLREFVDEWRHRMQ
ncbi:hypothetical protein N657DRAFT_403505 [Parathielavia appendiculata]|uniref:Zn(2)-C6 fungal-type domain-containing protein n=1 Tax=Parathielavia appendiculata TaxID=2587402 RepID=A0AAN6TPK7_9PEZI|nr:hypothetical protein N657DRAFT_403505 [Parathielavia appendiculata]